MTLHEALAASPYKTATREGNGLYTTVDGGDGDGFSISTGELGMPATGHQFAPDESTLPVLLGKLAQRQDWEPVGEQGETLV